MFTMRRYYELRYDLSKNIKLDYNATVDARVDEPDGKISANTTPEKVDTIRQNFWKGGRTTKFDQTTRVNFNIPVNKLPYMQFVQQLTYNYSVNYQWLQAPPAADSLGNTIQNSQQQQWNLNLNFVQLYNKSNIYKKIMNPGAPVAKKPKTAKDKATAKGKDAEAEDKTRDKYPMWVVIPVKLLTMVKNAGGTYSTTRGTALPGFQPRPQFFGQNFDSKAPGLDFIFGMQDPTFRYKAAENGWISSDPRIVSPYIQNYQEAVSARAQLEPINDFRIELTASKNYSRNLTAYFRYDEDSGMYRDFGTPIEQGSYSISYSVIRTAFSKEDENGVSEVFKQFQANRMDIARRLAMEKGLPLPENPDSFPEGYGGYQQDVLIPAFLSAYRGVSTSKIGLTPFQNLPIPNFRITYNGLSKLKSIKEFASNVSLQSGYQSTYNVAGFQTVMDTSRNTTLTTDFAPAYVIRQISITERFGPLIGIDITLVNNITTSFKYNRDRTLNLALGNRQLNEQKGEEFVFGIGYRTNKLVLPFDIGGKKRMLKNDINFRFDFTIRENETTVRNLDRPTNEPVSGQNVLSIKPTIDYSINEKLMLRIFYDRRRTTPFTSNSFPTIITSGGFSIRYTIQ
jgi:cell surface protein SprA